MDINSSILKYSKPEGYIQVPIGYYWYEEQDTNKIIYVFGEYQFTELIRYYYYDFSEKTIRSFRIDNAAFLARTKKITDLDTIKVYDLQLNKELIAITYRYATLIRMLRSSIELT